MRWAILSVVFAGVLALGTTFAVGQGVAANMSTIPYVTASANTDQAATPVAWYGYRYPRYYGYYSYPNYGYTYAYPYYGYSYQPYYNYQPAYNGYYSSPYSSYYAPNGYYYQAARPYYYYGY